MISPAALQKQENLKVQFVKSKQEGAAQQLILVSQVRQIVDNATSVLGIPSAMLLDWVMKHDPDRQGYHYKTTKHLCAVNISPTN